MAELDVKKNANDCLIELSTKFDNTDIRFDNVIEATAIEISKPRIGNYGRLGTIYKKGADLCARTLRNKKIDVQSIKSLLKDAKKKCLEQAKYCEIHRKHWDVAYMNTQQLVDALEGKK